MPSSIEIKQFCYFCLGYSHAEQIYRKLFVGYNIIDVGKIDITIVRGTPLNKAPTDVFCCPLQLKERFYL